MADVSSDLITLLRTGLLAAVLDTAVVAVQGAAVVRLRPCRSEMCDDVNSDDADGCTTTCGPASCGNAIAPPSGLSGALQSELAGRPAGDGVGPVGGC